LSHVVVDKVPLSTHSALLVELCQDTVAALSGEMESKRQARKSVGLRMRRIPSPFFK
jgi:hypothetical protein